MMTWKSFAFATAVCVCGIAHAQSTTPQFQTMIAPVAPASAGLVEVDVFFLNVTSGPLTLDVPTKIDAKVVSEGAVAPIELVRDDAPAVGRVIAPGTFGKARYRAAIPATIRGTVQLEAEGAIAKLDVPPTAVATTTPTPAPRTETTSSDANEKGVGASLPGINTSAGLVEYVANRLTPHESIYFVYGGERPNAKFQISLKYQIFNSDGPLAKAVPAVKGFHLAYTQLSFWDIEGDSSPFFDSSYKPELLWIYQDAQPGRWGFVNRIDLQAGVQHESNGLAGADSRSLNIAYVRPVLTFGDRSDWFLTLGPRVFTYLGDTDDNPDIDQYRGWGDIRAVLGKGEGLQLATTARFGQDWNKTGLQFDLTYPIGKILGDNVDLFFHVQYFTGYGESLVDYNQKTDSLRFGLSLVR